MKERRSRNQQIIFYYDRVCVELILDSKNHNNLLRLQIAHGYRQQQKNGEKRGGKDCRRDRYWGRWSFLVAMDES